MNYSDCIAIKDQKGFRDFCKRFSYNFRDDMAIESWHVFSPYQSLLGAKKPNIKLLTFLGLHCYLSSGYDGFRHSPKFIALST